VWGRRVRKARSTGAVVSRLGALNVADLSAEADPGTKDQDAGKWKTGERRSVSDRKRV
jgi:hypothetical protein